MIRAQYGGKLGNPRAGWINRRILLVLCGVVVVHAGILLAIMRQPIAQTLQSVQLPQVITVTVLNVASPSQMISAALPSKKVKAQSHSSSPSRIAAASSSSSARPMTSDDATPLSISSSAHPTEQNAHRDTEPAPPAASVAPTAEPLKTVQKIECSMTHPVYPLLSRQRAEQGTAQIRIIVDTHGRVEQAMLEQSSGFNRLDQAALQAAKTSRCHPYQENGVRVRASTDVPFKFSLED